MAGPEIATTSATPVRPLGTVEEERCGNWDCNAGELLGTSGEQGFIEETSEGMIDDDVGQEVTPECDEAHTARRVTQPDQPTQKEIEEHELTHFPYRPWCIHCVRGQGINDAHKRKSESELQREREHCAVTTFSIDYGFINDSGQRVLDDEYMPSKHGKPILVAKDRKTGGIAAIEVDHKGKDGGWAVKRLVGILEDFGYVGSRVVIKCDQEPAIKDLAREVGRSRGPGVETVLVNSEVGESMSNGDVENTIRRIWGLLRTMVDSLKSKLKVEIDRSHILFPWLLEWCAGILNRYHRDSNGWTPYRRMRGKDSEKPICEFGERIMYKPLRTQKTGGNKLDNYKDGVWLGVILRTNEVIVGTDAGVVKARSIRRLAMDKRWDRDFVSKVRGCPRKPVPGHNTDRIPIRINNNGEPEVDEGVEQCVGQTDAGAQDAVVETVRNVPFVVPDTTARSMYVTKDLIRTFGKTDGCPGCQGRGNHTEECRSRIFEAMGEDESCRIKVERAKARAELNKIRYEMKLEQEKTSHEERECAAFQHRYSHAR